MGDLTPSSFSPAEYLRCVSERAGVSADSPTLCGLERLFLSEQRLEALLLQLEGFGVNPGQGHPGLLKVCTLPQALVLFSNPHFQINNWHYDRTAGVVLVNLKRGVHESLSAQLLAVYQPSRTTPSVEENAERFIDEGLGWFVSSSSIGKLLKGPNVSMSAQEKTVFHRWL